MCWVNFCDHSCLVLVALPGGIEIDGDCLSMLHVIDTLVQPKSSNLCKLALHRHFSRGCGSCCSMHPDSDSHFTILTGYHILQVVMRDMLNCMPMGS